MVCKFKILHSRVAVAHSDSNTTSPHVQIPPPILIIEVLHMGLRDMAGSQQISQIALRNMLHVVAADMQSMHIYMHVCIGYLIPGGLVAASCRIEQILG